MTTLTGAKLAELTVSTLGMAMVSASPVRVPERPAGSADSTIPGTVRRSVSM
ncbi:hypothetical protein [Ferrimicrobium acidiphilum]|uniref:hypothetical protein n=1 Tax=Ferrimicrobium acidiphilum TaxID=121039 RepID=UPI0012E00026|nr:hypothetical protein [Ferrimicrobium acidiphilum]